MVKKMEEGRLEKIQEVLQEITPIAENFKKKEAEFTKEFKKSKNSLLLVEDFLSEVGSLTNSFMEGWEKIKGEIEEIEDDTDYLVQKMLSREKETNELVLSLRFEIASILDDLVNFFPDILLRENLEIFAGILRNKDEEIKNHFVFPRLKKSV